MCMQCGSYNGRKVIDVAVAAAAKAKKKAAVAKKNKTMETQAQKKKNTKSVKGSTKGAGIKSTPAPKPTSSAM